MDKLTITLTPDEWDRILAVLSDAPFKIVNPLINKILEQARQQRAQAVSDVESDRIVPRLQPVN